MKRIILSFLISCVGAFICTISASFSVAFFGAIVFIIGYGVSHPGPLGKKTDETILKECMLAFLFGIVSWIPFVLLLPNDIVNHKGGVFCITITAGYLWVARVINYYFEKMKEAPKETATDQPAIAEMSS